MIPYCAAMEIVPRTTKDITPVKEAVKWVLERLDTEPPKAQIIISDDFDATCRAIDPVQYGGLREQYHPTHSAEIVTLLALNQPTIVVSSAALDLGKETLAGKLARSFTFFKYRDLGYLKTIEKANRWALENLSAGITDFYIVDVGGTFKEISVGLLVVEKFPSEHWAARRHSLAQELMSRATDTPASMGVLEEANRYASAARPFRGTAFEAKVLETLDAQWHIPRDLKDNIMSIYDRFSNPPEEKVLHGIFKDLVKESIPYLDKLL